AGAGDGLRGRADRRPAAPRAGRQGAVDGGADGAGHRRGRGARRVRRRVRPRSSRCCARRAQARPRAVPARGRPAGRAGRRVRRGRRPAGQRRRGACGRRGGGAPPRRGRDDRRAGGRVRPPRLTRWTGVGAGPRRPGPGIRISGRSLRRRRRRLLGRRRRLRALGGIAFAGHALQVVDALVDVLLVAGEALLRLLAPLVEGLVDLVVVLAQQVFCLVHETHPCTMDPSPRPCRVSHSFGRRRTCEGRSSSTLVTPMSCRVRTISAARSETDLATPRRPPAISPYRYARPTRAPLAPSATAARTSAPWVMPVSTRTSARSPSAWTVGSTSSNGTGARSSWRPPWLDSSTASAPASTTRTASSTLWMPLTTSLPGQFSRSQVTSSMVSAGSKTRLIISSTEP